MFTQNQLPQLPVTRTVILEYSCASPAENLTRPSYSTHSRSKAAPLSFTRPTPLQFPLYLLDGTPRPGYWLMTHLSSASLGRYPKKIPGLLGLTLRPSHRADALPSPTCLVPKCGIHNIRCPTACPPPQHPPSYRCGQTLPASSVDFGHTRWEGGEARKDHDELTSSPFGRTSTPCRAARPALSCLDDQCHISV